LKLLDVRSDITFAERDGAGICAHAGVATATTDPSIGTICDIAATVVDGPVGAPSVA
jgi:hypothetical protein